MAAAAWRFPRCSLQVAPAFAIRRICLHSPGIYPRTNGASGMKHRILMGLLFVLAAFSAMADVRHTAVPVSLRGAWAAEGHECNKTDARVVPSEQSYAGPKGHCAVRWV